MIKINGRIIGVQRSCGFSTQQCSEILSPQELERHFSLKTTSNIIIEDFVSHRSDPAMARLWTRTRSGFASSIPFSSRQKGRVSPLTTKNSGTSLDGMLEEIENTVASLPWDIDISSSEDGNIESCILEDVRTEPDVVPDIIIIDDSSRQMNDENDLEMKFCHFMDVLERHGLLNCMSIVNDNVTDSIFPIKSKSLPEEEQINVGIPQYSGIHVHAQGSLYSM